MNDVTTMPHPLRTIHLRFDGTRPAPDFETRALEHYHELHDRVHALRQLIRQRRGPIAPFELQIEEVAELLELARQKFEHLGVMIPENPERETVRAQLRETMAAIDAAVDGFVPALSVAAREFFDYEDYIFAEDEWMLEVAFPLFDEISARYEECSVDLVSFDRDLNDFKTVLASVKKEEGRYLEGMDKLVDSYSNLNYEIDVFFGKVSDYDEALYR